VKKANIEIGCQARQTVAKKLEHKNNVVGAVATTILAHALVLEQQLKQFT